MKKQTKMMMSRNAAKKYRGIRYTNFFKDVIFKLRNISLQEIHRLVKNKTRNYISWPEGNMVK